MAAKPLRLRGPNHGAFGMRNAFRRFVTKVVYVDALHEVCGQAYWSPLGNQRNSFRVQCRIGSGPRLVDGRPVKELFMDDFNYRRLLVWERKDEEKG